MKIKLELFGASRDFSNKDHIEFQIKEKTEIKDFRKEIIDYLEKNFKGNEDFKKIVYSFEYEETKNEANREISLIQPTFISQVVDEARGLFR